MIPRELATRFELLDPLSGGSATRMGVWRVHDLHDGQVKVLKCAAAPTLAPEPLLQHLRALPAADSHFVVPTEHGTVGDIGWSLTPWYGERAGTLGTALQRGEWGALGHEVVRALCRTLALLHKPAPATHWWVLHGDVKPANVLLVPEPWGSTRVLLADFDGAILVAGNPIHQRLARYTTRQAAPEVLSGAPLTPAADWWSFGMLVAEAVLGQHPLEGLSEPALRSQLAGDWPFGLNWGTDAGWRALLGGLLHRDDLSRWGAGMVERWLVHDPMAWAEGLRFAGETASAEPFHVAGTPVFTARDLARAALQHWQVIR